MKPPGRVQVPATLLLLALASVAGAEAASKAIDLDGKSTNGAESACDLAVLSTYPVKIQNKVTNRTAGDAFSFKWYSAGPGGFTSSTAAGKTTGVGAKWTWTTSNTLYAFTGSTCAKDVCFTKTAGPDPITTRGPFAVPGRSLTPYDVTSSNASLTSSLISFFSPPQVLVEVTSSVQPLGGGQVGFTTTYTNNTDQDVTVDVPAYPEGCCPDPHNLNCDGTCVAYLSDPDNCGDCGNACAEGASCDQGTCVSACPEGTTACGGACVDLAADPSHCGACGQACGADAICSAGACVECRPPTQTACGNACVNIHTDAENCGACGIDCNALCPSSGQGACSQGQSCICSDAGTSPASFQDAGLAAAAAALVEVTEAPVCQAPAQTTTVPPGTTEDCQAYPNLAQEAVSTLTVCGDAIPDGEDACAGGEPASAGPFPHFVRKLTSSITGPFLTPVTVQVQDGSGDGLLQPGETAGLKIGLANAGPTTVTNLWGVLASPAVDLTDDGVSDPVEVALSVLESAYADAPATPFSGDCSAPPSIPAPAFNGSAFRITVGAGHPGDVARPVLLSLTGLADGVPFSQEVPLTLGIASACDPAAPAGSYDGLDGLISPMARLVPAGDPVPFPAKPFAQGKTRPMKLRVLCGGTGLDDAATDPPQIVALSEKTAGPIDITKVNLNDSANPYDPFFRFDPRAGQWNYALRTKDLARGTYEITIVLANRKAYVSGFVLQ